MNKTKKAAEQQKQKKIKKGEKMFILAICVLLITSVFVAIASNAFANAEENNVVTKAAPVTNVSVTKAPVREETTETASVEETVYRKKETITEPNTVVVEKVVYRNVPVNETKTKASTKQTTTKPSTTKPAVKRPTTTRPTTTKPATTKPAVTVTESTTHKVVNATITVFALCSEDGKLLGWYSTEEAAMADAIKLDSAVIYQNTYNYDKSVIDDNTALSNAKNELLKKIK